MLLVHFWIFLNSPTSIDFPLDGCRFQEDANWTWYNLADSLRKETESSSSTMWNLNLPGEPMVDFHKFFDGENIILQGDLVACINVGMHLVVCVLPLYVS